MTLEHELKAQLCAVLTLSNLVEDTDDFLSRKIALEQMQTAIQKAKELIRTYAADLIVELEDDDE